MILIATILFTQAIQALNGIEIQLNAVGGVACPYTASW
jgi:hypothetical protein